MIKNKKNLKWLIIAPVLILATVLYSCSADQASGEVQVSEAAVLEEQQEAETEEAADDKLDESEPEIFVDVGGAVEQPGVVRVESGCRVFEAIQAAGGEAAGAQTKYMNLAAVCEDGQKIYIPTEEEIKESADSGGVPGTGGADTYPGVPETSNGKININTASSEQLQTLSGIGPSMASRIIEYREANGKFAAVEDLTKVSGIGEKTLSKFIADICV